MSLSLVSFGFWDIVLVLVVTSQITAVAYLSDARWKGLALTLPLPFTTLVLGLNQPIDASNVLALATLFAYVLCIRILHLKFHVSIVPAIALSVILYATLGSLLAKQVPATDVAFWIAAAGMFGFGVVLRRILPQPSGPPYRTPLPLWQKLPIILLVVGILMLIKNNLQGFASLFPLVSTVGAYEVRRDLWILVRTVPTLMCALIPLMAVVRTVQEHIGLAGGLILGWLVFLPILIWMLRPSWTRPLVHPE